MGLARQPSPEERSGLTKVIWFGILQIVGNVAAFILPFFIFWPLFFSPSSLNIASNATPAQVATALSPMFQNLSLLIGVGLGIGLVGSVILTWSFRDFRRADNPKFNTPWIFMLVLILGTVISAIGLIPLFNSIPNVIAQSPTTSATPSDAFF
jgi:hypothetical protein